MKSVYADPSRQYDGRVLFAAAAVGLAAGGNPTSTAGATGATGVIGVGVQLNSQEEAMSSSARLMLHLKNAFNSASQVVQHSRAAHQLELATEHSSCPTKARSEGSEEKAVFRQSKH